MPKIMYKGKEYGGSVDHAKEIPYDNTKSGLTATDVNSAIDEVSESVENIADYIVEQGSNDYWYYEKWNSGKAKCWTKKEITATGVNATAILGGYHSYVTTPAYPLVFKTISNISANGKLGSGIGYAFGTSSTTALAIYVLGNQNSNTIYYTAEITGTWK